MMDQDQISYLMAMIIQQMNFLKSEMDKCQKELELYEENFERVKHLIPGKAYQKQLDCMKNRRKYIEHLNRTIFGLKESWNSLETSKLYLDKMEFAEGKFDEYGNKRRSSMVQVGDIVRVVDTAEHGENGWKDDWVYSMNDTLGRVGEIMMSAGNFGLRVKFNPEESYNYPSHVLRKVGQGRWSILS